VKVTGCTVHFVDQGIDTGPIIAQETVPVLDGDTYEKLHARVQEAEHRLYPRVIAALAAGKIAVKGRQTLWLT
jgi:phosphoribosylglycinamide formyltransferase-1